MTLMTSGHTFEGSAGMFVDSQQIEWVPDRFPARCLAALSLGPPRIRYCVAGPGHTFAGNPGGALLVTVHSARMPAASRCTFRVAGPPFIA